MSDYFNSPRKTHSTRVGGENDEHSSSRRILSPEWQKTKLDQLEMTLKCRSQPLHIAARRKDGGVGPSLEQVDFLCSTPTPLFSRQVTLTDEKQATIDIHNYILFLLFLSRVDETTF